VLGFGILVQIDSGTIIRLDELQTGNRLYGCGIKNLMIKAVLRIFDRISKFRSSLKKVRTIMRHFD